MRCEKITEIILTDYIDGNLKNGALREIESHLGSCPECRRIAEEARSVSGLFKAAPRHEAPPKVWRDIRARVSARPAKTSFTERVLEWLKSSLPHPRPAFVLATAVTLVLFALMIAHFIPGNGYFESGAEQNDIFITSYLNGDEEEAGFGTPAEDFFL